MNQKNKVVHLLFLLCFLLVLIGCPSVTTLNTANIGVCDTEESLTCTCGGCIIKETPYVAPPEMNLRYHSVLIDNRLSWGFYLGLSGITPFLKAQLVQNPFHLGCRLGVGGCPIFVPVEGAILNYFADATMSFDISEHHKIYFGIKNFGLASNFQYRNPSIEEDPEWYHTWGGLFTNDEAIDGIWLGGYVGCRIKHFTFEGGIYRVLKSTNEYRESTFGGYTPSIGFAYSVR